MYVTNMNIKKKLLEDHQNHFKTKDLTRTIMKVEKKKQREIEIIFVPLSILLTGTVHF